MWVNFDKGSEGSAGARSQSFSVPLCLARWMSVWTATPLSTRKRHQSRPAYAYLSGYKPTTGTGEWRSILVPSPTSPCWL